MNSPKGMKTKFKLKSSKQIVPEGYFHQLESRLNEIPSQHSKRVKLIRFRPWTWSAAAAILLFGSTLTLNTEENSPVELYTDAGLEMMAIQMSDEMIYSEYLQVVDYVETMESDLDFILETSIEEEDLLINY